MRSWIVRIVLGLLALIGIIILAIAGLILFDSIFPSQRVTDFTNVTYTSPDGIELHAYEAKPEGKGPYPAIILVHEFYGLNESIIKKADLLAQQGYLVLAVDAYRGNTTKLIPRAIWLVISTPQDQIRTDLDSGYTYLADHPDVEKQKIGALGFCFGGTQVMHMATRNRDIAATVIFYGSGPITDPAQLGVMAEGGPILGVYGEQDQSIPLDEVRAFEQAMRTQEVEHQISIYPGVGHAFVQYESLGTPGAAQEAWNEMLAFLENTLQ